MHNNTNQLRHIVRQVSATTLMFTVFAALFIGLFISSKASAEPVYIRWTVKKDINTDLESLVAQINVESGLNLKANDFLLLEQRELANYGFKTYLQTFAGVPIKGQMIRVWTRPNPSSILNRLINKDEIVQMEAHLEDTNLHTLRLAQLRLKKLNSSNLKSFVDQMSANQWVRATIKNHTDKQIKKIETENVWLNSDLVQIVTVKAKRGTHTIQISHFQNKVISSQYEQYPQADLDALVYPIYEETEKGKVRQNRIPVKLTNLNFSRREMATDPYAPLRSNRYWESKIDPVKAETEEGRALGFWSSAWLLRTAKALLEQAPVVPNSFSNGLFLEGQFATVSLHPSVTQLKGIDFSMQYSGLLNFMWKQSEQVPGESPEWEVVPMSSVRGRQLSDQKSPLGRSAERDPQHDVVTYINSGFDEVQVYYAVNRFMESLHTMGLSDPELSTRPFHAYLYDTDISMKNNAYYTDDTINFTTYSPEAQNYARDNSTIWHELGHGIMDRLMGPILKLADSGGLAEGMADYLAKLVIEDVTEGKPFDGKSDFRIENQIGFNLTNESHDDGEAYGGAMKDILDLAVKKDGQLGVKKMTDLTLDAMRLSRNHPALTANDWFEHMLFADELGRAGLRAPGEMKEFILEALRTRNFRLDRGAVAQFEVLVSQGPGEAGSELTDKSTGSRYRPYRLQVAQDQEKTFYLKIKLIPSEFYQFKYPVKLSANFNGSPLQGPARWKNEDKGDVTFELKSENDTVLLPLTVAAGCDEVNREDGSCHDYTHIQVINNGDTRPVAKKRFYVQVK
jgi:hypothetical protein